MPKDPAYQKLMEYIVSTLNDEMLDRGAERLYNEFVFAFGAPPYDKLIPAQQTQWRNRMRQALEALFDLKEGSLK